MRLLILLITVFGVGACSDALAAPVNLAAELANLGRPAPREVATTPESDTLFANGYDNNGSQCLTEPDCPSTGSQCSMSTCNAGMCGTNVAAANTTCTAGEYCTGGSCVCDGMGSCTTTCNTPDMICASAPDACHTPGICTGQFCIIYPQADGTICGISGTTFETCQGGVCR